MDFTIDSVRVFDGCRFRDASGVRVRGGRIAELLAARTDGSAPPRALVLPGITDAHVHLLDMAIRLVEAELSDAAAEADVISALPRRARSRGGWLLGHGLAHATWRPRAAALREQLDRAFPDTPVRLLFTDGHSALLNRAALARMHSWQSRGLLPGVRLEGGLDGRPTGVAVDTQLELAGLPLAESGAAVPVGQADLETAVQQLAREGIACVHDLLTTIPAYLAFRENGLRGLRLHAYFAAEAADDLLRLRRERGAALETDTLQIRGLKCFADGTLGSSGALLTRPYLGQGGNRGFEVAGPEELEGRARFCLAHGLQLAVHAIGDGAVANTLNAIEAALKAEGAHGAPVDHRFRVEHAEVLREEDLARCRRLGVVVSMQPCHFTDDAKWLPDRVDPETCARVSLWKRLLSLGVPVCFGSDAPFTRLSALEGIESAVRRLETVAPRHRSLFADEALTPEQALACYTSAGAYAAFAEASHGTLVPGAPADLTVLDRDLQRVLLTIAGGEVTWSSPEGQGLLHAPG